MTLDAFASIAPEDWPQLTFGFHPASKRLELATNAVALFKALSKEAAVPEPQVTEPEAWVIWRKELAVTFRALDSAEAVALDCVIAGGTFEEMCEHLCEHLDAETVPAAAAVSTRLRVASTGCDAASLGRNVALALGRGVLALMRGSSRSAS